MNKLRLLATERKFVECKTSRGLIRIENLKIPFTNVKDRQQLSDIRKNLVKRLRTKTLVTIDNKVLFGELAILKYLHKDGWNGVWTDNYCKCFWSEMPYVDTKPAKLPPHARQLYDMILIKNGGKTSGFFDVFAWKADDDYMFLEYKGKGDRLRDSQLRWIELALSAGIKPEQLVIVNQI